MCFVRWSWKTIDVLIVGTPWVARINVLKELGGLNVAIYGPPEMWGKYPQFSHWYCGCVDTEEEVNELCGTVVASQ